MALADPSWVLQAYCFQTILVPLSGAYQEKSWKTTNMAEFHLWFLKTHIWKDTRWHIWNKAPPQWKFLHFFSAENTFVMIAGQKFEDGNNSSCWSLYPYIFSIPLFLSTFIDLTDTLTHVFPGIFLLMQNSISAWAMRSNRNHVAFSHYFLKNGTVKMSEPLSYARITWDPCCICCFYLPYRVCVVSL